MMLNIKVVQLSENVLRYLPLGGIVGFIFFLQVLIVIDSDLFALSELNLKSSDGVNWAALLDHTPNVQSLGKIMYTNYFYLFIVSGLILLVAMIGAIVLTMYKRGNVRRQDIIEQLTRDFERVVYLKS